MMIRTILHTGILFLCTAYAAVAGTDKVFSLSGTWYARTGFDSTWLTDTSTAGWTAVTLPGPLDLPGYRQHEGAFVTVKRYLPAISSGNDETCILTGFYTAFPAEYFVNGVSLGMAGSADPYVHAYERRVTAAVPPEAVHPGEAPVLAMVLYRDHRFMYPPNARGAAEAGCGSIMNVRIIKGLMWTVILVTIFMTVGLYYLLLGVRHLRDRYNLYFGVFCLGFAVFTFANSEIGQMAVPATSYLLTRLDRISIKIMGPLFVLFLSYLFTGRPSRTGKWWGYYCGVLLLVDMTVPVYFNFGRLLGYSNTLDAWMVSFAVAAPVVLYRTWQQIRARNRDAMLIGGGLLLFILAISRDLLQNVGIITAGEPWAWSAFPLFILGVAVVLANRYADSRKQMEQMNVILERKVGERTRRLDAALALQKRTTGELQEFVQVASHDLQEPLRKVTAFGSRLSAECSITPTEKGHSYLESMQNSARRMAQLLDGLIMYSRVMSADRTFTDVDLGEALADILEGLQATVRETGAKISVSGLGTVRGDAVQLRQLLRNLLDNALRYIREGTPPEITVHGSKTGDGYELTVADNGIGIAPKHYNKVFAVFEQLHNPRKYGGTGMGLAICKKIAERHGGTISVAGSASGGALFTVQLSVAPAGEDV